MGFTIEVPAEGAASIARQPDVQLVEPNLPVRPAEHVESSSTLDGLGQDHRPLSESACARDNSCTDVRAYVIGAGVSETPELAGRLEFGPDRNRGENDSCRAHGTDVAAALGGTSTGVAPSAIVVSVGVLGCRDAGSVSDLLAGLDWVADHAILPATVVISSVASPSVLLDDAVTRLVGRGIVVVVAAGDDSQDACGVSPARVPDAITVAASDRDNRGAAFSNFGACVDLYALGVGLPSGAGDGTVVSGSSFAAGLVAGAAARVLEVDPNASPTVVAATLVANATKGAIDDPRTPSPAPLLNTSGRVPTADTPETTTPPTAQPAPAPPNLSSGADGSSTSSASVVPPGGADPNVAAAVPAGSGMSAFVTGTDGQLWWKQATSDGWWSWQAFGGAVIGKPTAVSTTSGVYVFVRGSDNAVWFQRYDGTRWSAGQSLGGGTTADPIAVTSGSDIYLFVRGNDYALYWRRFNGSWSPWQSAGGFIASNPVAAADATSAHVFVRGLDGALHWQRFTGNSPSGWSPLGGGVLGDPAAAADASGVSVFVRGLDWRPYLRRWNGNSFSDYQNLGGAIIDAPAAVGAGNLTYVLARGLDSAPYVQPLNGTTPLGWTRLGGVVTAPLSAAANSAGITVFARGGDTQLYVNELTTGWSGWAPLPGVPLGSQPVALAGPEITAGPPAAPYGLGFDTCEAPPTASMQTWRAFSPFTSVGVYIGGENRACRNVALDTPAWVNTVVAQGWRLIPTYVGAQAPCINFTSTQFSRDPFLAALAGAGNANDAANRTRAAGLPVGSPVYFDLEGYNSADAGCVAAVRAFISGWTTQLRANGFRAGMYSSLCSGIRDVAALYDDPSYPRLDAIWIAAWNGTPNIFGFGAPCPLSDAQWTFHQRLHQYQGGHNESYGGVTINIDRNVVDGPTGP